MRTPTSRDLGFAAWLSRLAEEENRGTLAALRRGLLVDEDRLFELYGYLPPNFLAGLSNADEQVYLMVAALFAYHPAYFTKDELKGRPRNLGESLRLLAQAKQPAQGEADQPEDLLPESLKRRVEALLAAHREDLFGYLRQVVSLLKSEDIKVDWAQLLNDLQAWEWSGNPVQWQWSRSFYVGHQEKGGDESHVS
ncbi:MAG TPA: type I-E CRISPR-associated protein Cse2/CasB [Symbiobacteriaceae bacterium]|jgi:CRISPR type I-E-associated protein CasB/Cse2